MTFVWTRHGIEKLALNASWWAREVQVDDYLTVPSLGLNHVRVAVRGPWWTAGRVPQKALDSVRQKLQIQMPINCRLTVL